MERTAEARPTRSMRRIPQDTLASYLATTAICAATTGICFLAYTHLAVGNLAMIYLLGVASVATLFGPREAVCASLVSVAALNFFFVPPRFTFSVDDTEYLVTLIVTLSVAILISTLAQTLRSHAIASEEKERQSANQLSLSRMLSKSRSKREIVDATCQSVRQLANGEVELYIRDPAGEPELFSEPLIPEADSAKIRRAFESDLTLDEDQRISYHPLSATIGPLGVIVVKRPVEAALQPQQADLLAAFVNHAAVALERAFLAKESHRATIEVESERLKNSLLSSVSHDLRTPLTAILGAASTLQQPDMTEERRAELASTIYDEADRLNRLVRNLLDMTRLESGHLRLNLEWNSLEELLGSAAARTEALLSRHDLRIKIEPDIPLVFVDGVLLEQVLINLLENESRHTPPGTEITISASVTKGFVRIELSDKGPGFKPGEEEIVFEKFQRGESALGIGTGLGLAISRAILKAHGSQIWARTKPGGGAQIVFELKIEAAPEAPDE